MLRRERYYGGQSRSFTLRHDVDQAKAEAKSQDGVLDLNLPYRTREVGCVVIGHRAQSPGS
jgi:HSP20 family protein